MKITVLGGSGFIGSKVVNLLRERGHEVVAASLASGVNTFTGEGLDEALAGAEVVLDVINSPSYEDQVALSFFETSEQKIIAAEVKGGVKHHLLLSIVGADRLPESGYYRGNVAQEKAIQQSPIPYTILRSTQFFDFLGGIAQAATDGQNVRLSPALVQPVAADVVVTTLANLVEHSPLNDTVEIAGPERIGLSAIVERFLLKTGDTRHVMADANARYFGAVLNDQSLTPGANAHISAKNFEEWFHSYTQRPHQTQSPQAVKVGA